MIIIIITKIAIIPEVEILVRSKNNTVFYWTTYYDRNCSKLVQCNYHLQINLICGADINVSGNLRS